MVCLCITCLRLLRYSISPLSDSQLLIVDCRYKLNIESAEDVAHEYGVNAVPTFMVFKDGGMLPEEKITGPHDRQVREAIEKCLK